MRPENWYAIQQAHLAMQQWSTHVLDIVQRIERSGIAEGFARTAQIGNDVTRALDRLQGQLPPNLAWQDYEVASERAAIDGLGYAWGIPGELALELLETPSDSQRREVIRQSSDWIANSCAEQLASRTGGLVTVAILATELHQEGRFTAAQSIAANVIEEWFAIEFKDDTATKTKDFLAKAQEPWTDDQILLEALRNCVLAAVATAWTGWDPSKPPLANFSRHQTAHHISQPDTVSAEKSLQAISIATSVACHHGFPVG